MSLYFFLKKKKKKTIDKRKITKNSPLNKKQQAQINEYNIKLIFFLFSIKSNEKLKNNRYKKIWRVADEINELLNINIGKKAKIVEPANEIF